MSQSTGRPLWKERLDRLKVLGGSDRGVAAYKESDAPLSIETTIDRPEEVKKLDHLVMVAAHSIWKGCVPGFCAIIVADCIFAYSPDATHREHDHDWILQEIQKGGSIKTFYKHIEAG